MIVLILMLVVSIILLILAIKINKIYHQKIDKKKLQLQHLKELQQQLKEAE